MTRSIWEYRCPKCKERALEGCGDGLAPTVMCLCGWRGTESEAIHDPDEGESDAEVLGDE